VQDPSPATSDAVMDDIVDDLIRTSRLVAPDRLLDGVAMAAGRLGASDVHHSLCDHQQRMLRSLATGDELSIEGSVAGRCFVTDDEVLVEDADAVRLFLPLIDGAERLGVVEMALPALDEDLRRRCGRFTALVAELVVSRGQYTDALFRARRGDAMSLEAEMAWQLLIPLTFSIPALALSVMIEPAYDVGGDAFDYAHTDGTLHLALFDAMGHGVQAALTASLAVGAYRHGRRRGRTLVETYEQVDAAVVEHRPDAFATAILAELDCSTGELDWIAAGHPPPILVRERSVTVLECAPSVPVGVARHFANAPPPAVCRESLEPGDRVLFYSDGCTEAATPSGEVFGEERLVDFLVREQSAGRGLGETVRRLSHAVIDHAGGQVADDATVALVEYRGTG
jgi:hypothetical protein